MARHRTEKTRWILCTVVVKFFFLIIPEVKGCGTMLHTDIAERTSQYFNLVSEGIDYNALVRRHPDAFQAGSPYPDSYYSGLCYDGIYHQVSEDTHWTPFLNATVNYIRRVYPRPWDRYTEKLVVFLLGIVAHQVADVNWHALGVDHGFLDVMGKQNYHGSFGDAHSDGDVGGDILTLFETDTSFIGVVTLWYVPVDDLIAIYEELYGQPGRMPREVIENCTMLLFLGRLGESLGVIELLYPRLVRRSPFILDRLGDYYVGGVDDMAVWSGNVWTRTVTMLDKGTSACDLPNNPVYIRCNGTETRKYESHLQQTSNSAYGRNTLRASNFWDFNADDVLLQRSPRGIYLSAKESVRQMMLDKLLPTADVEPFYCNGTCETPVAYYKTEQSYSQVGKKVVSGDVNGDGFVDVVISASVFSNPGNYQIGRVYIVYGTSSGLPDTDSDIETLADLILTGEKLNGRFGQSVAIIDFNADGLNDLVISAPSVGSENLDYYGQVYVFLYNGATGIPSTPSITIDCTERYCNLGWTLASADLNNDGFEDLIIGSPFSPSGGNQRGLVGIFYASPNHQEGNHLTELDFDWRFTGQQDYEWFGFSISGGQINNEAWLLIGAPTYRICTLPGCEYVTTDIQAVGRLFVFQSLSLLQIIEGKTEFEQFSYSVNIASWNGNNVAIISSVSGDLVNSNDNSTENDLEQSGVVRVFRIDVGGVQPEPLLVLEGDRKFSRFGSTIMVYNSAVDGKSNLLISAPYRSEDLTTDRESGRVYLYQNLTAEVSGQQADRIFGIHEDKARLGCSFAIVPSQNRVQLVVGAEHYTYVTRLGGAVTIFDL